MRYTIPFDQISLRHLPQVGGKNASLGEMHNQLGPKGVHIPNGFATTADAYRKFLSVNGLADPLAAILSQLDRTHYANLHEVGAAAREMILAAPIPDEICRDIEIAYAHLCQSNKQGAGEVAVRSSATAEDLPEASFAGQMESFLNVRDETQLLQTIHQCFTSLYTDRAIKYREDRGFAHANIAVSVGVQRMVRSDQASSGVAFTLDPDTGFEKVIVINGGWGLGENIVQGRVTPDEFIVFKPLLNEVKCPIISKKLGTKELTMVYATDPGERVVNRETSKQLAETFVLKDKEVIQLAKWCVEIEQHYGRPMDIEWAKDGIDKHIYIVQARPETIHAKAKKRSEIITYHLKGKGEVIATGIALGEQIAFGNARILHTPEEAHKLAPGEVLVTEITNPDWDPVMKRASAIVTDKGGRTSHAAIVARELGLVAIVGAGDATRKIQDGEAITVSCAEGKIGKVYRGQVPWEETRVDISGIQLPKTDPMLILGDPDRAFQLSFYPNRGVGLLRLEFIITNSVRIHPLALTRFDKITDPQIRAEIAALTHSYPDKESYFVDKLSQAVATIAAAFYPHDVIVRMSDFKSNEYANLLGGKQFEPTEENPMLGFRGASRYYSPLYQDGFVLECKAMKRVRGEMGLKNVKLMIPFCRTIEEGRRVVQVMQAQGLRQGENGLEIYMMVEIPSNVLLAESFAEIFDGFSIGSNDLTQLTLGLDRDSSLIAKLFNEQNPAVKELIATAIRTVRKCGIKIGLCGQAPSDFPEFAEFLVEAGINSISFNPDALIRGIENISKAEARLQKLHSFS